MQMPTSTMTNMEPQFTVSILEDVFRELGFDTATARTHYNAALEIAVRKSFSSMELPADIGALLGKIVQPAAAFIWSCYPSTTIGSGLVIAKLMACLLYIDTCDPGNVTGDLEQFATKYGDPAYSFHDPIVHQLAKTLRGEVALWYGAVATAGIINSAIGYVVGRMVEIMWPNGITASETAVEFPGWFRRKTGVSELFCHALFPKDQFPDKMFLERYLPAVPYLIDFLDAGNDALSFYKEAVVGNEDDIIILVKARMMGVSPVTVLKETCDVFIRMAKISMELLKGIRVDGADRDVFDNLLSGYIMWHCVQKRYRLSEIGIHVTVDYELDG